MICIEEKYGVMSALFIRGFKKNGEQVAKFIHDKKSLEYSQIHSNGYRVTFANWEEKVIKNAF